MKFDPSQAHSKQKAEKYFTELINGKDVFDLTKKSYKTIKQNSYLHLIIAWLAMEIGVTLEFAKKHYYKRSANPQLFVSASIDPLTGSKIKELRSTADLSKEELQDALKDWGVNVEGSQEKVLISTRGNTSPFVWAYNVDSDNEAAHAVLKELKFEVVDMFHFAINFAIGIATGVMTLLILVFGEITPKSIKEAILFALSNGWEPKEKGNEMYVSMNNKAIADQNAIKKKPSTSELLDWIKLLLNEDIDASALRENNQRKLIPPLYGALLKNEQDVSLLEKLAFMSRRNG